MIKKGLRLYTLPEIGKIKTGYLGKEKISKNNKKFRPPKKLGHFVITTTQRDKDNNLIRDLEIHKKIDDMAPRELQIRLPFDSIDKNFFTQYQYYGSRKKECSGDGEIAHRKIFEDKKINLPIGDNGELKEVQAKKGDIIKIKCNPETCPIYQAEKCKVSGTLSAFLPQSVNIGGVYKFRTHSYNAVSGILSVLQFFSKVTGGILQGMPFKLIMIKKHTEEYGEIDYVTIVIDGLEIQGLRKAALKEKENRKLLGVDLKEYESKIEKSGFFVDNEPEDIIAQEYYPENDNTGFEAETIEEKLDKEVEKQEKKADIIDKDKKIDDNLDIF